MSTDLPRTDSKHAYPGTSADEPSLVHLGVARSKDEGSSVVARGQNFVVEHRYLESGSTLTREQQKDEYLVVLLDEHRRLGVESSADESTVEGKAVCVIPQGDSRLTALDDLHILRVFTSRNEDVALRAVNREAYREANPAVSPLGPASGARYPLQIHRLADHPVDPGRFGRAFRSEEILVNFINPRLGPRDPSALSPHVHDDFEQGSVVLSGDYVHHIRRPWTKDLADWRPDRHIPCGGPSLMVIPPGHVHTSQAVGTGENLILDVFAPPREDLVARAGFVLNQDVYRPESTDQDAS